MVAALEEVTKGMDRLNYPPGDIFAVRLALEEALVNALKHGHGYDPTKVVHFRHKVTVDEVWLEAEDEGSGFKVSAVPDPRLPVNRERSCGRGLLLMRHYLSWIRYNDRGNCVTLCKTRSPRAPGVAV
jgi:serine/threonine-protein kinase RsbW